MSNLYRHNGYVYSGWSCPSGPAAFVDWLVGRGEEIDHDEFAREVDLTSFIDNEEELEFLATDWHVTYLRTELPSGTPAYVMQHSGIEHLFLQPGVDYYEEAQLMDDVAEWSDETYGVAWPEDLDAEQIAEMRRVFFPPTRTAATDDVADQLLRRLPAAVQDCVSDVTIVPAQHRKLYLEAGAEGHAFDNGTIFVLEPSAPGTITSFEERFYHEVGHVVARCLLSLEQRLYLYRHGDDMQHEEFASAFGAYMSGDVKRAQQQHSEVMPVVEAVLVQRTARFRFNGAVYREALTPEQKQLKRQYLWDQEKDELQARNKIPSLEEVLKYQLEYGDDDPGDYGYDITLDDGEVWDWLEAQSIHNSVLREELTAAVQQGDEQEDELIERYRDEAEEAATEQKGQDLINDRIEELYYDAEDRMDGGLEGADCWRMVNLPTSVDPTIHPGLGVYWAYNKEGADAYWGHRMKATRTQKVTYRARVDLKNVDRHSTVLANTSIVLGKMEAEVQFFGNAPIFVYDVELPDGTVLEINDWRRC